MSLSLAEAINLVHGSETFKKISKFYPSISFEAEIKESIELSEYLKNACSNNHLALEDPRKISDAPKLNEDFSKYFVINNLPVCTEEKSKSLTTLLIKLYQKMNINFNESAFTMPLGPDGQT